MNTSMQIMLETMQMLHKSMLLSVQQINSFLNMH